MDDYFSKIVFEANNDGKITFANHQAFKIFGYGRDDFDRGLSLF